MGAKNLKVAGLFGPGVLSVLFKGDNLSGALKHINWKQNSCKLQWAFGSVKSSWKIAWTEIPFLLLHRYQFSVEKHKEILIAMLLSKSLDIIDG